jgi:ribose transport system permease protein
VTESATVIAPELKPTTSAGPRPQLKILGILGLLIAISVITAVANPVFLAEGNIENVIRRTAMYGILGIGVAFVIITGGIDLSIGSVIALVGMLLPFLLVKHGWHAGAAIPLLVGISLLIGLTHGLLITKLKLQPFVVTLCGLLIYRGVIRGITEDRVQGFGNLFQGLRYPGIGRPFSIPVPFLQWIYKGNFSRTGSEFDPATGLTKQVELPMINWVPVPMPVLILIGLAIVAAIFLNRTIYGRYLLALGRNEQAARYSGINTDRMVILAYVICSLMAGLGGMLFIWETNGDQPSSFGNFYELYAIAAAVLGGCSLRGGEGSIVGVIIGAAVMQVLYNAIVLLGIPTQLEFAIIGAVILIGVIADEVVRRYAAKRRAARQAA